MGRKILIVCLIFLIIQISCKRSPASKAPIFCDLVYRIPGIQVKLIDKNTGNSLIFGKNAKYSISQIHIINLYNGKKDTNQFIYSDSTKQTISVLFGGGQDTTYLIVPTYSPDTLVVHTVSDLDNCGQLSIASTRLNRNLVCSPCNNYTLTIQK